jgi:cytochrome c oxidase cbb3-type subunit 1
MERYVKAFIIISIVYLGISSVIGVMMLTMPVMQKFMFMHVHFMLLGWVSMMIYGVGYHILPRFSGKMLKSVAIIKIQFYLANIGLIGMTAAYTYSLAPVLLHIFGGMEVLAIMLFFYNMVATIGPAAEVPK